MTGEDRTGELQWIQVFPLLHEQVASIIRKLSTTDADGNPTAKLEDYLEAMEILPPVLKAARKVPRPRGKQLREAKRAYEDSIEAFIKAAELGIKTCHEPSPARLANVVYFIGVGNDLLEQASKAVAALRQQIARE